MSTIDDTTLQTLAAAAGDPARFRGLALSGRRDGGRLSARLALVRGDLSVVVTDSSGGRETTRTVAWADWPARVREALEEEFTFLHIRRDDGDYHVRVTRKGRVLMSRGKPAAAPAAPLAGHDREKAYALTPENAAPFLKSLDALDEQGRIRPSMQAKYRQINGFLNVLEPLLPERVEKPYIICDAGCGSAHLSFAVFHYLAHVRGWPVRLTGVDRNGELMAKNRA